MDERPVHFELHRHGETPHGQLGFHLRFTRMRDDVTCRRCMRYVEDQRQARAVGDARRVIAGAINNARRDRGEG